MSRDHRAVLLIVEDPTLTTPLVERLRALGCAVFLARDLDHADDLLRAGLPAQLLLVRVAPTHAPPEGPPN